MKIISVQTMRDLDRWTIDSGVAETDLMARAAQAAFREILEFVEQRWALRHRARFLVLAGRGNNGGDAYVVARLLHECGEAVCLHAVSPTTDLKGAARHHAEQLPAGLPVHFGSEIAADWLIPGTVVVDGLLGTGIHGTVRPPYQGLIAQVNASALPVVALDVPSGLDADTGHADPEAVVADLTVTMAQPKRGLLTPSGLQYCGCLRCVDIGIPEHFVERAPASGTAVFSRDVAAILGRRPRDGHKGTFGHTLVVGGSTEYTGAPMLTAAAALRSGCGLATAVVPASTRALLHPPLQALILRPAEDGGTGFLCDESVADVAGAASRSTVAVFGPGVGNPEYALPVLEALARTDLPLVLDADGLRTLALAPELASREPPTILTPHPGEMRVLLRAVGKGRLENAPRQEQAVAFAKSANVWTILKGHGTLIASPRGEAALNTSGTDALASAGTGDVLAGLLGGFLAQGLPPREASWAAVFLHGLAAEIGPTAARPLVADDLLSLIPEALGRLSPHA